MSANKTRFTAELDACSTVQDFSNLLIKPFDEKKFKWFYEYLPKAIRADTTLANQFSAKYTKFFVSKLTNTPTSIYGDFSKCLLVCKPMIQPADAKKITSVILNNSVMNKVFYGYVKKDLIQFAAEHIDNDTQALQILKIHYKKLGTTTKQRLISLLPNGEQNAELQAIISKTPDILKRYQESDMADPIKRAAFIKLLIKRQSLMNKVEFNLRITLDDLKQLPTMMRFTLLKLMYMPFIIIESHYTHYRLNWDVTDIRSLVRQMSRHNDTMAKWRSKISVEPIALEDMETLLFSAALKKNETIAEWYGHYKRIKQTAEIKNYLTNLADMI